MMEEAVSNQRSNILPRIQAFENLGFGMFIHWGLYSQLGIGEWALHLRNIPMDDYMKLQETFTAEKFDADAIASLAKAAGMKYIVITARHHDGFSLYDTRGLNDYDAPHSAAGRDLMKEYVDACNRHGIVPFFYHTTLDWHNPDFNDNFDRYLDYLNDSVEILCSHYGKIGGLWFDGNWSKLDADWKETRLYETIRKHQPEAIIVNNTGLDQLGRIGHPEIDSVTFEQAKPRSIDQAVHAKYVASEMCFTINAHWGYGKCDFNNKSTAELIETLAACRKIPANLLLNVGPTGEGEIPLIQQATLREIGSWIHLFEDAIYEPKPFGAHGSGRDFVLRNGEKLYFFVHDLSVKGSENVTTSGGQIGMRSFTGIHHAIKEIKWMDNGEALDSIADPEKGLFAFYATGYPYGVNTVVRVAEATLA